MNIHNVSEFIAALSGHCGENANEALLIAYVAGIVLLGLPMALTSLWCYWMEEDLDNHWYYWPLKKVRNFLHPGSFIFLPDWEHRPRSNYRMCYEGPIGTFIDNFDGAPASLLFYIVLASLAWPIRLIISGCAMAICIVVMGIATPFLILNLLCKLICLPFKKKSRW